MILDESEADEAQIIEGGEWNRERWWHRLIQVCRRWRYLALQSAYHLRLSLVCGRGTPVADMLAHSPPAIPLIIDHSDGGYQDLTAEEEDGIILALKHSDRVRRIRLLKPIPILQRIIIALDGEFPILEFLLIMHQKSHRPVTEDILNLNFPETFRAPHLHRLLLRNFATPIESPPFTSMRNLVTLFLAKIPSSAYFHPNALLKRLSIMPQLEKLGICFNFSRDVERELSRTPIMTRVTLPNLRWLSFRGAGAYLEALLPWVTIPLLEKLHICFLNQMIYSIPHLQQFMSTAENLRFNAATFRFDEDRLAVGVVPYMGARLKTFYMEFGGKHLDWQVVPAAQVFHTLRTVFSAVEHLILDYDRHKISSDWNDQADRSHWRELLGSFDKVKTLRVVYGLVEQVSRALQPGEGESPTELLPELQKLSYSSKGSPRNAFALFIDTRQKEGHPVTVVPF